MFTGMELTMCPNLAVSAEVMHHVAQVESDSNPFAIGVVGGQLARQPKTLDEAIATVRMLDAAGYNYSLGIAQVNRSNLGRYGLDTYKKAFDACANVAAGAKILAECYGRSGHDWGKAFSCYYSGNFVTGYRDGYVQKIYASINAESGSAANNVQAIPLRPAQRGTPGTSLAARASTDYRVALRSVALDTAATALVTPLVHAAAQGQGQAPSESRVTSEISAGPGDNGTPVDSAVFKPVVRGPQDTSAVAQPAATPDAATTTAAAIDHADLRSETHDAAFVF